MDLKDEQGNYIGHTDPKGETGPIGKDVPELTPEQVAAMIRNIPVQFIKGDPIGEPGRPGPIGSNITTATFKHSGNSGDIIYSLAGVKEIYRKYGWKAIYMIWNNRKGFYYDGAKHPLGDYIMNDYMLSRLKPLLEHQPYIQEVKEFEGQKVAIDLDLIRQREVNMPYGHIARWYFYLFPDMACDLSWPWLTVPYAPEMKDMVIINRTSRYRNPHISYAFLRYYPNVVFVGTEGEYEDVKKEIPNLVHVDFKNFLELASAIYSCKLFIGNQSMCFAIAEATKANRIVELCAFAPNVIPEGPNGYDFYSQTAFEYYVEQFLGKRLDKMPEPAKPKSDWDILMGYMPEEVLKKVVANTLVDYPRLVKLAEYVKQTEHLDGVIAEVGVYKGGTALLMASLTDRYIFLCDTFKGMPAVSEHDLHQEGDFSDTSDDHVLSLLPVSKQAFLIRGIFPQSARNYELEGMFERKYSLVHIDVDIYQSVKDCLEFFYPRMVKGGIIVLDDVNEPNCPGAKLAFEEFMADKIEKRYNNPELFPYMTCQSQVAFVKL